MLRTAQVSAPIRVRTRNFFILVILVLANLRNLFPIGYPKIHRKNSGSKLPSNALGNLKLGKRYLRNRGKYFHLRFRSVEAFYKVAKKSELANASELV